MNSLFNSCVLLFLKQGRLRKKHIFYYLKFKAFHDKVRGQIGKVYPIHCNRASFLSVQRAC